MKYTKLFALLILPLCLSACTEYANSPDNRRHMGYADRDTWSYRGNTGSYGYSGGSGGYRGNTGYSRTDGDTDRRGDHRDHMD